MKPVPEPKLEAGVYDLAIIGGGIIGAGVARDAARRGIRTILLEKNDFGAGTTAGSTRLIHGGLRYLEMLDFGLVRMDLREREILLRIAPHLIKPLPFNLPYYDASWFYRTKMRIGLALYDLLSYDKSLPNRCYAPVEEVVRREPSLRAEGLSGASTYYDAQVDLPERLCLENVLDAARHGAVVRNGVEVLSPVHQDGRLVGVRVRGEGGNEEEIRARIVLNTSGPWFDDVAARLQPDAPKRVRKTKGVHLAVEALNHEAWVLFSPVDNRLFFAIPWMGMTWIGTTDTDYPGDPANAAATPADIEYLLRSTEQYFPAIRKKPVRFTNAGVRALVTRPGKESDVSRSHQLVDGERVGAAGLVSVIGGKITGYRAIAEETTDLIARRLGFSGKSDTASALLPGAVGPEAAERHLHDAEDAGIARESATALLPVYGARMAELVGICRREPSHAQRIHPDYPEIQAQVELAISQEYCRHLDDFLARRTALAFSADQGRRAVDAVVSLMAPRLGWDQEEVRRQRVRWDGYLSRTSPSGTA